MNSSLDYTYRPVFKKPKKSRKKVPVDANCIPNVDNVKLRRDVTYAENSAELKALQTYNDFLDQLNFKPK